MRRSILVALVCVLSLLAGACVSSNQPSNTAARKKKGPNEPVVIGFSMDTLKEERWQRDKDLVEKRKRTGYAGTGPGCKQ